MNRELPKSIRDALAQQASGSAHPSADVLTAFAERTLTSGENVRVSDHLASCSECREVVYLASSIDGQYAEEALPVARPVWWPRPKSLPAISTIAFIVAGVIVMAGIFLRLHFERTNAGHRAASIAQLSPPQLPSEATNYVRPPATKTEKATAHPPKPKHLEAGKGPRRVEPAAIAAAAPSPPPRSENQPDALDGKPAELAVAGPIESFKVAPPTQNGFAARSASNIARGLASTENGTSRAFVLTAVSKTWRVTPDGHLEHLGQAGWARVLTDKPVEFRAVSESPNGVWAGGSRAELFHSADGGVHWKESALPSPPDAGGAQAIVSISFGDLQNGTIVTESGACYLTSDAGESWHRQ